MKNVIKLPPEVEFGNKEYKLKIIPDNDFRLEQLASQMKWRINEGNGIAFYFIGVDDDGTVKGISKEEFTITIKNLNKIIKFINAKIVNINNNKVSDDLFWHVVTINFIQEKIYNSRIIFMGPTDSGKTTLISNLANNISDDGKGKSRKLVFNHKHEIYSGRTSSISIEKKIIKKGKEKHCLNLIDTPGYDKYMKTTLSAVLKYDVNLIMLCINPLDIKFTNLKFYLDLISFLNKSFLLILTKKDLYQNYHKTFLLKSILQIIGKDFSAENVKKIPIIEVDNITKVGYQKILNFFSNVDKEIFSEVDLKFQICDIMKIPNLGKIYTGILLNGILEKNRKYLISNADTENEIIIKSIHYINKPLDKIDNNQLVTLQLEGDNEFCNKTDKIISINKVSKKPFLLIKSAREIDSNYGVCIYNNQYCVVNISKEDQYYKLFRKEGFININSKIILKINDKFIFANLIN